jgi:hypothetical protein
VRDKILGESEIKLETQTHMKTKIKATLKLKNNQNIKGSASLSQNKQPEIEKRFSYLETQRQNEVKNL